MLTDQLGSVNVYGCENPSQFQDLPTEQFFHTDYQPVRRDAQQNVVDEATEVCCIRELARVRAAYALKAMPHLMPRGALCDIEGNMYTPAPWDRGYGLDIPVLPDSNEMEEDKQCRMEYYLREVIESVSHHVLLCVLTGL